MTLACRQIALSTSVCIPGSSLLVINADPPQGAEFAKLSVLVTMLTVYRGPAFVSLK